MWRQSPTGRQRQPRQPRQQPSAPRMSAQYVSASAALTPPMPSTKNSLRLSGFGSLGASETTAGAPVLALCATDLRSGGAECRPPRSITLDGDVIFSCLAAASPEGALCKPSREGALSSLGALSRRPLSFFFRPQPRFLGLGRTVLSSLGSGATLLMELQKPMRVERRSVSVASDPPRSSWTREGQHAADC